MPLTLHDTTIPSRPVLRTPPVEVWARSDGRFALQSARDLG
jgi:hypothetical protein